MGVSGPGPDEADRIVCGQGRQVRAATGGDAPVPAGDEYPAVVAQGKQGRQVVGIFSPVENEQSVASGQSYAGAFAWTAFRFQAKGTGDLLTGGVNVGLVVEGVEEDAVGKAGGWLVVGGQMPDGFGGQGALAHAAGPAEGNDGPGLEVAEKLGKLGGAVLEVVGAGWALQGRAVGRGVDVDDFVPRHEVPAAGIHVAFDVCAAVGLDVCGRGLVVGVVTNLSHVAAHHMARHRAADVLLVAVHRLVG